MSTLTQYQLIACHRVADMTIPRVPSFVGRCVDCGASIWVAHSSPLQTAKICLRCVAEAEKADDAA